MSERLIGPKLQQIDGSGSGGQPDMPARFAAFVEDDPRLKFFSGDESRIVPEKFFRAFRHKYNAQRFYYSPHGSTFYQDFNIVINTDGSTGLSTVAKTPEGQVQVALFDLSGHPKRTHFDLGLAGEQVRFEYDDHGVLRTIGRGYHDRSGRQYDTDFWEFENPMALLHQNDNARVSGLRADFVLSRGDNTGYFMQVRSRQDGKVLGEFTITASLNIDAIKVLLGPEELMSNPYSAPPEVDEPWINADLPALFGIEEIVPDDILKNPPNLEDYLGRLG